MPWPSDQYAQGRSLKQLPVINGRTNLTVCVRSEGEDLLLHKIYLRFA